LESTIQAQNEEDMEGQRKASRLDISDNRESL
jgi:hypothetical protein